jgi:DNA-binding transcriptional LysR family regulator
MSERLTGIEAFVAAVETGNFALAAQRLHLTRSAVGKSVARLEARLGTRLFHRTTRSQSLTETGEAYYERCRRALAELDAADAALEAGRATPMGRLRLSMPELIGRSRVAPLLIELGRQYPTLSFDVSFTDRRVDLIEEAVDLAIRSGGLDSSATLSARRLGCQRMGVYAAPAYLADHSRPASFDAMLANRAEHSFVGYARESWPLAWRYYDADGRVADVELPSQFTCNSFEVGVQAAIDGLGLVRVPTWLVGDALASGRLLQVFEEARPYEYELHAVWPATRSLPCKTRVLIDLLVARLPASLAG